MTRINIGVEPHELCDQHLRAEYRELPRAVRLMWSYRGPHSRVPMAPTLGKGHVLYFIFRRSFLSARFRSIVAEMRKRGYVVQYSDLPQMPTNIPDLPVTDADLQAARLLLMPRIAARLSAMKTVPYWTAT